MLENDEYFSNRWILHKSKYILLRQYILTAAMSWYKIKSLNYNSKLYLITLVFILTIISIEHK